MSLVDAKIYNLKSLSELGGCTDSLSCYVKENIELNEQELFNIKLVISELVINGFLHGHADKRMGLKVLAQVDNSKRIVHLVIDDGGKGFDTMNLIEFTDVEKEHGRGLIIVRAFTDNIKYNENGSRVHVSIKL